MQANITVSRTICAELQTANRDVIWLSAPAGSGKSKLAEDIVRGASGRYAWLRMEPGYSDTGRFLTALASAFAAALPGTRLPPLGAEDIIFAETYLRQLFATAARGENELHLVIDDLHVVGDDSEPSRLLSAAAREMPPGMRIILATRNVPDPAWAWFTANGRDRIVRFEDLRVSESEAKSMIETARDAGVTVDWSPQSLIDASGGWMLGARMLLRGRTVERLAIGAEDKIDDAVLELIAHEVLQPFETWEKALLAHAAHLPNLTIPVLTAAADLTLSEAEVRQFVERVLFLEMDGGGRVHMHDLLKSAVALHLSADIDAGDRLEANIRTGNALLDAGELGAGLALLSSAGAWEALSEAVAEHGPTLGRTGDFGVLFTALDPMPEAERAKSLAARYWHGVSMLNVNPTRARQVLDSAYAQARTEQAESWFIPLWAALVDAIWLEWVDCSLFDPLIEELPALQDLAERIGAPEQEAMLARGAFAALSFRRPEDPAFPFWEERNLGFFWQAMPRHETIRRGIHLMFRYCWGSGERWKADQVRSRLGYVFDEAIAAPADICTRHVVSTEFMAIFEPNAEDVARMAETGLATTARYGLFFWDAPMLNAALYRTMSQENRERGRRYLDMLAARLGPESRPHDVAFHEHFTAYDHWLDDRLDPALIHAKTAYRTAIESGFAISPVYYGLAISAIVHSKGRRREAFAWMRRARRTASAQNSFILVFVSFLRGAVLAAQSRDSGRCRRYLEIALSAGAAKRFYVHPWIRRREMADLLARALEWDIETEYAQELIRVLDLGSGHVAGSSAQKPIGLKTLGRFDILVDGASVLTSAKLPRGPAALTLHLVVAGRSGENAETLIDRMWPDADEVTGRNRLKSTVYRLRQLFSDPGAVITSGGRVVLNDALIDIDAWELEAIARQTGGDTAARYHRAQALFAGPFVQANTSCHEVIAYAEHVAGAFRKTAIDLASTLAGKSDWSRALAIVRDGLLRAGHDDRLIEIGIHCADRMGNPEERNRLETLFD